CRVGLCPYLCQPVSRRAAVLRGGGPASGSKEGVAASAREHPRLPVSDHDPEERFCPCRAGDGRACGFRSGRAGGCRMIACVRIPYFVAAVERRDKPELEGAAFALVASQDSRRHITAVSAEAAGWGVQPGMTLPQAQ